MRLINCSTLRLEEFFGSKIPRYAILSHMWGDEEVSFADFTLDHAVKKRAIKKREGYQKILFTCKQALEDGLRYAWVDTCCIDKSSSAELTEAINSMFSWYRASVWCYAYLSDVLEVNIEETFPKSRWFTRGWTLQELLAPDSVRFYDRDWNELGSKYKHAGWISEITAIDIAALNDVFHRGRFCVAKKMSWAAFRETTRTEDVAYCLFGIFNINMPLLYGEGDRAFIRLQEEIMKSSNDDSILAWDLDAEIRHPLGMIPDAVIEHGESPIKAFGPFLAQSPSAFHGCGNLVYGAGSFSSFAMTNLGLQMQLPLIPISTSAESDDSITQKRTGWIRLLGCYPDSRSGLLGILLHPIDVDSGPNKKLRRAALLSNGASYWSIVVGPRVAARSVVENVTIINNDNVRGQYDRGYRHTCVNELRGLQAIGYHVSNGMGLSIHEGLWDPLAMQLTLKGSQMSQDLLSFHFEPQWNESDQGFTVFIHTGSKRTVVQKGSSFSLGDKESFYYSLEQDLPRNEKEEEMTTIEDSNGDLFRVVAEIHYKQVHDCWIVELNVDAVPIVGVSLDDRVSEVTCV